MLLHVRRARRPAPRSLLLQIPAKSGGEWKKEKVSKSDLLIINSSKNIIVNSHLSEDTDKTSKQECQVDPKPPKQYCDAATAAAKLKFQMAGAVKINPLVAGSSRTSCGEKLVDGLHTEENPVFYGQRTKIRKTKEQEMISALLEVAEKGNKLKQSHYKNDAKYFSGNEHKKRKSLGEKKRKMGGPFILRPRPPLRTLTQHTLS